MFLPVIDQSVIVVFFEPPLFPPQAANVTVLKTSGNKSNRDFFMIFLLEQVSLHRYIYLNSKICLFKLAFNAGSADTLHNVFTEKYKEKE